MIETLEQALTAYDAWLDRQSLAAKTCVAYRLQIYQYSTYLALPPSPVMIRCTLLWLATMRFETTKAI